jgi:hypothetical protein
MMDVTDVLRDRMNEPAGLQRMVSLSIAAHVALFAALFFAPAGWLGHSSEPETVMTITLGGGTGPSNGGMTAMAARPIQAVTPPPEVKRPEPVRRPVQKTPEMTVQAPKPVKSRGEGHARKVREGHA